MATQKDVADLAGVSFITVSRVVNKLGNVREDTRRRVEDAIRTLNYYPNRQAQALNHGLTHTLGLVTPRMFDLPLYNNFYVMSLLSGVETKGRELGWDVLLTTDYDQEGDFDFLRVWHPRKVDGLVFVGLRRFPSEQIREIEAKHIPSVSIADRIESPAISWIDSQNEQAAAEAVERLGALGHRNFAFLGIDPARDYNPNFQARERAVRAAVAKHGWNLEVFTATGMDDAGPASAWTYLSRSVRPTAVIAGNDSVAMGFRGVVQDAGWTCPRDFSLVGFDAEPSGQIHDPTLASFRQPLLDMGQTAVQVLIDTLTGRTVQKQTRAFPLVWVEGGSVGPL